ncbi:4Fe-4S dicluster domain-containing protein [Hyphobacterium sp. CCMP332]|nr:4Fe-4S dicluster domain-containing protein [Hyphobacterium sp. CCMP332]
MFLETLSEHHKIYAPVKIDQTIDYSLMKDKASISNIIYNTPKPVTPLKLFFLPVKENVVKAPSKSTRLRIILGIPSCDLDALGILDEFYLNPPYVDEYYKARRENTLLIGTDCHSINEHCHCTSYGVNPYPEKHCDITLSRVDENFILQIQTNKGEKFIEENRKLLNKAVEPNHEHLNKISVKRNEVLKELNYKNKDLPNYKQTSILVKEAPESLWEKYARHCVACGACATICPTCTCFLLIDRPGFEKVRQMDACQYPGFVRTAGGEDALASRAKRFRNRYMCKYVYKPAKFESLACTGCGRCIETCIARINKNELFMEAAKTHKLSENV